MIRQVCWEKLYNKTSKKLTYRAANLLENIPFNNNESHP
jgi:hypothetical protein